jgi:hypothetical protein
MIRHLIILKFKPETTAAQIDAIAAKLSGLPAVIDEIEDFEFGRDIVRSPRSGDFALVSTFADLDALKRYQVHPAHQEVLALVTTAAAHIAAVDYVVPNRVMSGQNRPAR